MKTVGIDARLYSQTGVGTYLRNFLHFLAQKEFTDIRFLIYLMDNDVEGIQFNNPAFTKVRVSYHWHTLEEQMGFYDRIMKDNLDLMHFTYFSYPVRYTKPFIATVHDLTPLQFKTGKASTKSAFIYAIKHAVFQYVLKTQVQNAVAVITPTETVKKQLTEYFNGVDATKIKAIYEGIDYELASTTENSRLGEQYPKPFFLYVGNFYPHKNVDMLVQAFKEVPDPYTLVLSGPNDYFAEKTKAVIASAGLTGRVFLHQNKGRGDLSFFYKRAVALVHPSLSEGFGLPLVEAMASNLPIIASDIPVFRELLPAQTPFFEPTSSTNIAQKLTMFLKQPIKPVYSDVMGRYSFEKMTEETLALYTFALQG